MSLKALSDYVFASEDIMKYIVSIIGELRNNPEVSWGPSPRATLALLDVAKICALLDNRDYVVPEDVLKFSVEILGHRIGLKAEYELEGVSKDDVIKEILNKVDAK